MAGLAGPSQYDIVEKATWSFVESLGIAGIARRGQVARTITETVVTALAASRENPLPPQMAGRLDPDALGVGVGVGHGQGQQEADAVRQVLRAEIRQYLSESRHLHDLVGAHVRVGLSQALEAGARSARIDHTPAEEDNRVHMASSDAVASASARMERLRVQDTSNSVSGMPVPSTAAYGASLPRA